MKNAITPADDARMHSLVVDRSPDLSTVSSADGTYRYVSAASLDLFGWHPAELTTQNQDSFPHDDDVGPVQDARRTCMAHPDELVTTAYRFRCKDGTYRWTEAVSRSIDVDGERLVVSTVRDIGDRKESELSLQHQASTDPLTGVANRTVFTDRLEQALRRLERREGLIGVLFLDLDRFKLINDSLGHQAGDAVLLQMAERLIHVLRPADTLARLGGDEFAVVVEDITTAEHAFKLGERIIEAGRVPFDVHGETFVCTVSVGVAVTGDAHQSAHGLLQEADLALYRAKDRGRDRAEMFDEDLRARAVGRLGTERMLRRAVDEHRLRVEYQPVIDLRTGATVAAEALVRVWDPELGMVEAESFVAVAEETGLLAAMDDWVLARAIEQAAVWRLRFAGTDFSDLAVNVTARHLADAGFAQRLVHELVDHGLPPHAFQVEVTERVLMDASNSAMAGLKILRDAGVKVGLDDFGTGYSSLSYLRQFPLDFVKIDRSFIAALGVGAPERAIVASIIDLTHALGMEVVAEGVESQRQLHELQALGCERAQGFYFAAAGSPEEVEARVFRSPSEIAG